MNCFSSREKKVGLIYIFPYYVILDTNEALIATLIRKISESMVRARECAHESIDENLSITSSFNKNSLQDFSFPPLESSWQAH